jgi:hypothetical protein
MSGDTFRVPGSGLRVLEFWVPGSGFRVSDLGFRVSGFGFPDLWFRVFRTSSFGFRVSGFFRGKDKHRIGLFEKEGTRITRPNTNTSDHRAQVKTLLGSSASDIGSSTSDIGSSTSDIGSSTSDIGSSTSDLPARYRREQPGLHKGLGFSLCLLLSNVP